MSTSLTYFTQEPVSDDKREQLIAALQAESDKREWWAEPLVLFDNPEIPGQVCGDTSLFCLLEEDVGADCYMAYKDAEFIIELLENVSKQFGVDWQLLIAGEDAGEIRNGRRTETVDEMLASFQGLGDDESTDFSQYDRATLLEQYPER